MNEELREALATFDSFESKELAGEHPTVPIRPAVIVGWRAEMLTVILEAARRIAEAEELWWCQEHKSQGSEPIDNYALCWYAANHLAQNQRATVERCRVVARLLVHPPEVA